MPKFQLISELLAPSPCHIISVNTASKLSPAGEALDKILSGQIQGIINKKLIMGEIGDVCLIPIAEQGFTDLVLLVGSGCPGPMSDADFTKILRTVAVKVAESAVTQMSLYLTDIEVINRDEYWCLRRQVEVIADQCYRFNGITKQTPAVCGLDVISIASSESQSTSLSLALSHGQAIADAVARCKNLSDLPSNICTPAYLSEQALALSISTNLEVNILGEQTMQDLGMEVFLSVGRASNQESKMIILEHEGGPADSAPQVLLGKGITFDTGGLCLKSRDPMITMKYDMAGAAAVLSVMQAISELALPINVTGILACAENAVGPSATKPSDVVRSMSGKTVEILNTDAEGRLVLCDALTYIERLKPAAVIDVATLTGACAIALGRHYAALFGNNETLVGGLKAAAATANDKVWQLPLSQEDMSQLDSEFADIANMGKGTAGSIVAALFLSRFAEAYPWAHLDISAVAKHEFQGQGATGRPVPLLIQYLLDQV